MKQIFFVLALGIFLLTSCGGTGDSNDKLSKSRAISGEVTATIKLVSGSCEMCEDRIESAALAVDGVTDASWSLGTKELVVSFNSEHTSTDAISKGVALLGHDTEFDRANDLVYSELPSCCQYR